jgi:hypothetical protein
MYPTGVYLYTIWWGDESIMKIFMIASCFTIPTLLDIRSALYIANIIRSKKIWTLIKDSIRKKNNPNLQQQQLPNLQGQLPDLPAGTDNNL